MSAITSMARLSFLLRPSLLLLLLLLISLTWTPCSSSSGGDADDDTATNVQSSTGKLQSVGAASEDGWVGFRARLLAPVTYTGTRKDDYDWNFGASLGGPITSQTWVEAKKGVAGGQGSYIALGWRFAADEFWGQRVRLQAQVSVSKEVSDGAYAALFVMVLNQRADNLIVFDNMQGRRIQARTGDRFGFPVRSATGLVQHEVVVDVPHPYLGDSCPTDAFVPYVIHVGFVFAGGRGRVEVSEPRFGNVHAGVAVTGGWRPWLGPPDVWDYQLYA